MVTGPNRIAAPRAPSSRPPARAPASQPAAGTEPPATADSALTVSDDVARRVDELVARERERDDFRQVELMRMKIDFDFAQEERAELQREMNSLHDLTMEQLKRDDEYVKKWIALV